MPLNPFGFCEFKGNREDHMCICTFVVILIIPLPPPPVCVYFFQFSHLLLWGNGKEGYLIMHYHLPTAVPHELLWPFAMASYPYPLPLLLNYATLFGPPPLVLACCPHLSVVPRNQIMRFSVI